MKIGLYGGSFNPPHISHVFAASYVSMIAAFDKLIVYPCFSSVTGKNLIDFQHRMEMCKLCMSHIPNVEISDVEKNLPIPSYTVNTVNYFKEKYPNDDFRLIVGSDIMQNQHVWKKEHLEYIYKVAPPFVLGRNGYINNSSSDIIIPNVSSSNIRELFLNKNFVEIEKVLPVKVLNYIIDNHLYE